jgi:hypothetical protein
MMRIRPSTLATLGFTCILLVSVNAGAADLDSFMGEINLTARADLGIFKAELSATFGVAEPKIDGLFRIASDPADVYMILRIGEVAKQPVDRVVEEYKSHGGQGWGVIAKNLGIKPGSPEFHSLKQGRLSSGSDGESAAKNEKGKGRGKG